MKKILIIISALLLSTINHAQEIFFGLKLGEKYEEKEIIEALHGHGEYMGKDTFIELDDNVTRYMFSGLEYDGDTYSTVSFRTNSDKRLFEIRLSRDINGSTTPAAFKLLESRILSKLAIRYKDIIGSRELLPDGSTSYKHLVDDIPVVTFLKDAKDEKGITCFVLSYMDLESVKAMIYPIIESVQDTFFGIKLGEKVPTSFADAVGSKGTYEGWRNEGNTLDYGFSGIIFGGINWGFGEFCTNKNDEFTLFKVQNIYASSINDKREAKKEYDRLVEIFNNKYGRGINSVDYDDEYCFDENDKNFHTIYCGQNGITAIISDEETRANDGMTRRYVSITYIHNDLYDKLTADATDEF